VLLSIIRLYEYIIIQMSDNKKSTNWRYHRNRKKKNTISNEKSQNLNHGQRDLVPSMTTITNKGSTPLEQSFNIPTIRTSTTTFHNPMTVPSTMPPTVPPTVPSTMPPTVPSTMPSTSIDPNYYFLINKINMLEVKLYQTNAFIESMKLHINNLEQTVSNLNNEMKSNNHTTTNATRDLNQNKRTSKNQNDTSTKSEIYDKLNNIHLKRIYKRGDNLQKEQNTKKQQISIKKQIDPSELIPMMIIGNMMEKPQEEPKHENKFEEIRIPDTTIDIRTTIKLSDLSNFVELNLLNLDEIAKQGKEFIQMIEKYNLDDKSNKTDDLNQPMETIYEYSEDTQEKKHPSIEDTNPVLAMLKLIQLIRQHDEEKKPSNESKLATEQKVNLNHRTINDIILADKDDLFTFFGKRYSINPRKIMRLVRPIEMLNSMIGMKNVKKSVYTFVSHFLQNNNTTSMLNTAIYGKPGVGKTDLGKILCMIYSALEIVPSERFKLVRASEMIGKYVGETRQKTKKILDDAEGGVLFIDEAYSLMSGSGERYSFGKECIDTLNQELSENRRKIVCIIAGYEDEIQKAFFGSNPGLERRFPFRYTLKDYTDDQLKDIMLRMIRLDNQMIDAEVLDSDIQNLFKDKKYFGNSGGDIENLLTKCKFANNIRSLGKHPMIRNVLTKKDLEEGLRIFKIHKKIDDNHSIYRNMFI